ncbi:branched-chain amino acid aminotransferase [Aureobasidium pullulans]|uniref:Branched-chain amino acid aminotransferase n=1 Tax=Aureobasidium pullulans TaxID=5580 RepID=A0A4S8VAT2_AURPU|nr:branched-chain amino acid aminotransferase [Aureobasidium pullulans]
MSSQAPDTSFPPGPSAKIVNGHVEIHFSEEKGWGQPQFVKDPYLRIHGLSPSLNYGQQAYEGMKAIRDIRGHIRVFRPEHHGLRLGRSAAFISIPQVPVDLFCEAVNLVVSQNAEFVPPYGSGATMYIRPVVIGLSSMLAPAPPKDYLFYIYVQPIAPYQGITALDAVFLEEYDRAAPKGTGAVKLGGNYAPLMRWTDLAKREGYGLILHLDSKTNSRIEEFSTSGFVGIKDQADGQIVLVTSNSPNVIASTTAESVMQIARNLGWKISYSELSDFREVFAAGTAAGLVPVRSITRKSTGEKFTFDSGDGEGGPDCLRLREKLTAILQGDEADIYDWCRVVTQDKD